MRKKIINLLILFLCFFSTLEVKAFDEESTFTTNNFANPTFSDIKVVTDPAKNYNPNFISSMFTATNNDDKEEKYYAYCVDPYLHFNSQNFVQRILLDPEREDEDVEISAADYGALTILKNGPWDGNETLDEEAYHISSMAIRMYIAGVAGNAYMPQKGITDSFLGSLYNWMRSDSSLASLYTQITNAEIENILEQYGFEFDEDGNPKYYLKHEGEDDGNANGSRIMTGAEDLLKKGMEANLAYKAGQVKMPKAKIDLAGKSDITETKNGGTSTFENLVVLKVELENFTKSTDKVESRFKINEVTTKTAAKIELAGYSDTYSTDEANYSGSYGENLVETYGQNATVYVAFKVALTTKVDSETGEAEDCSANFDVNYEYGDPELLTGAILEAYQSEGYDPGEVQRFYIYTNEIERIYSVANSMCNAGCDPYFDTPQICEDNKETSDEDGKGQIPGNVDYEFREGYENGSYNIVKCILKKSDVAGNSLKLVDNENSPILNNNPYCSIYCKEDYAMSMPYKKYTENGRYFQIQMGIKGQMDCYSTKIDREKYLTDVIEKQKELIDTYNKWQTYKEIRENGLSEKDTQTARCLKATCQSGGTGSNNPGVNVTCKDANGNEVPCTSNNDNNDSSCSAGTTNTTTDDYLIKKKIDFKGTYYIISDIDEETGEVKVEETNQSPYDPGYFGYINPDTLDVGQCNTSTCRVDGYVCDTTTYSAENDYQKQLNETYTEEAIEEFAQKVKKLYKQLRLMIDQYNGCSADPEYTGVSDDYEGQIVEWLLIYNYEPEISYSYDEPDPFDSSVPKWISTTKGLSCDDKTCDYLASTEEEVLAQDCSNQDNCSSVGDDGSVETIFDKKNQKVREYCTCDKDDDSCIEDDYTCESMTTNEVYYGEKKEKEYYICKLEGNNVVCDYEKYVAHETDYIHKVAVSNGKYDTPRVYYSVHPDGEIKISTSSITNADLVEGLPVGLSTKPETYFYILSLQNIGNFYSYDELGRIYGTEGTSLAMTVLSDEKTINDDTIRPNEYACTYTVSQYTCEDASGKMHSKTECSQGEDWETCKKRLCPTSGATTYCVKGAEGYYSCPAQSLTDSCTLLGSREEAISQTQVNYNCCPDCIVKCVGNCIIDIESEPNRSDLLLDFNTISPGNINPNDREMGYNWSWTPEVVNPTLVVQKAGNTITEITQRAEVDVDDVPSSTTSEDVVELENMKVTLTPSMINWIRDYNKDAESSGSYQNETLTCYDYTLSDMANEDTCKNAGYKWKDGKCVMSNVFCYSSFIDDLTENYAENVSIPNREESRTKAFESYQNSSLPYTQNNGYTQIITNDYWTIYKYSNLDINGDGIPDIGPSWK